MRWTQKCCGCLSLALPSFSSCHSHCLGISQEFLFPRLQVDFDLMLTWLGCCVLQHLHLPLLHLDYKAQATFIFPIHTQLLQILNMIWLQHLDVTLANNWWYLGFVHLILRFLAHYQKDMAGLVLLCGSTCFLYKYWSYLKAFFIQL